MLIVALSLIFNVLSLAQVKSYNNRVMIENQSRYSFDQTIDTLNKIITSRGWKVTYTHDMQETMKRNGKDVSPVKIMEICNPGIAYQILSIDQLRYASPMLPCRLSIYQKEDGKAYVSRMNAIPIARMIKDEASQTIMTAFQEVEEIVEMIVIK